MAEADIGHETYALTVQVLNQNHQSISTLMRVILP